MGRALRTAVGGMVYHVLNRANAGMPLFEHHADYNAFQQIVSEACARVLMRVLSYTIMPNHWHLVLWPFEDGDLSDFVSWLTLTHTQRRHGQRGTTGTGHLYQGRFKSFVVEEDGHLLTVLRYVERNPLRAGLVPRAEEWPWSSLWQRMHQGAADGVPLASWPVTCPADWVRWVNEPQTEKELDAIRGCIRRGRPFGSDAWTDATIRKFGLRTSIRSPGRPRKTVPGTVS